MTLGMVLCQYSYPASDLEGSLQLFPKAEAAHPGSRRGGQCNAETLSRHSKGLPGIVGRLAYPNRLSTFRTKIVLYVRDPLRTEPLNLQLYQKAWHSWLLFLRLLKSQLKN